MLLNLPTVLACSLVAGAVDTTPERVNTAVGIFLAAMLVLVAHAAIFAYRYLKKKRNSSSIFWGTFFSSVVIIPIVMFVVAMSAGTACGFGASHAPTYLLIFELIALGGQLVYWRVRNQPTQSPITQI